MLQSEPMDNEYNKKWYHSQFTTVFMLLIFFPLGVLFMWRYAPWKTNTKWIVTGIATLFVLITSTTNKASTKTSLPNSNPVQTYIFPSSIPTQVIAKPPTTITTPTITSDASLILVTRVIDGDTIEISDGQHVRYIGIDTPETVDPRTTVQCYGKEASDKNKELVDGKRVRLEKDISETDKYGRLLRYVYLEDGRFVNDILVKEGYAHSSSYPPDTKYQEQFRASQQDAMNNNRGLWGTTCALPTTNPTQTQSSQPQTASNGTCVIKGNISAGKEKIYHLPGCQSYEKTVIDTSTGEQWFCTEQEALQAGWRKAQNCQ